MPDILVLNPPELRRPHGGVGFAGGVPVLRGARGFRRNRRYRGGSVCGGAVVVTTGRDQADFGYVAQQQLHHRQRHRPSKHSADYLTDPYVSSCGSCNNYPVILLWLCFGIRSGLICPGIVGLSFSQVRHVLRQVFFPGRQGRASSSATPAAPLVVELVLLLGFSCSCSCSPANQIAESRKGNQRGEGRTRT